MHRYIKLIAALTFSCGLHVSAHPMCMPLQSVINEAVNRSPLVMSAEQNARRSVGVIDLSRSNWKPKISAFGRSAAGDSSFGQAQIDNSGGLRVTQRLFDFGASKRQREAAEFGKEEANYQLTATRENEALLLSLAYVDALESEATLGALKTRESFLLENNEALNQMMVQGAATRADVAEARAEIARVQADLTQSRFQLEDAKARLKARLGHVPQRCELEITQRWLSLIAPQQTDASSISEVAVARDPLIAAERAKTKKLKIEERSAEKARLPIIELVGSSAYGYDQFNEDWGLRNQIGIEINIPLLTGGSLSAHTKVAKADAQIAHFRTLEIARSLKQDVEVGVERLKNLRNEIVARKLASFAVKEHLDATTSEYEAGGRSFSELIEIRLRYDAAALQLIQVEHDYARQLAVLGSWSSGLDGD